MTTHVYFPVLLVAVVVALAGCDQKTASPSSGVVWQSVRDGDVQRLAKCLAEVPGLANAMDEAGNSLLYESVVAPDVRVLEHLLANGAEVNHRNQFGRMPLHRAADEDRLEVVRLLLDNGAEVNARDCRGSTPLIASAEFASLPVLKLLVEAGADVPTGNHYGRSALHNAAKREETDVVEFLIEHGARLNQVCEYGTPLDLTANCEVAEVLQAAGGAVSTDRSIASRTHDQYLTRLPSER
ncbi:MAG: ankyrin repeat domain-containing protein [Verrucomicrobiota bacterium]|jgi:ankyrin repeat protein|nr:ankyrin repeat domain-containing protein [Verrucomicrobiota bacterium]